MNALTKFVASSMLTDAAWSNTTIISEDVPKAVARMKHEPTKILRSLEAQRLRQHWRLIISSTSTDFLMSRCSSAVASDSSMACPTGLP